MARKYPRDLFLDYNLTYTGSEIDSIVDELYEEIKQHIGRLREPETYKHHIKILVLNFYEAYRIDPRLPVAISGDSTYYSKTPLSFRKMTNIKEALIELGYIRLETKGVHKSFGSELIDNPFVKSNTSTYCSKPKLHRLMYLNLYSIKPNFADFKSVRVGNKETGLIQPKVNKFYKEQKESLKSINEYYDSIHIDLFVTKEELTEIKLQLSHKKAREEWGETGDDTLLRDLNFRNKQIYRKFYDNTYKLHGRFYGGFWQGLPSKWRRRITINNMVTTELDFTNMHFAMLYHERGEKMIQTGDLYDFSHIVPDWKKGEYRNECKLVMNYMLNCNDDEHVIKVIEKNKKEDFKQGIPKGFKTWQGFIDFLKEANKPIADRFYRNQGLRLMNLDSQIVEQVIKRGVEKDICILAVHDSFICKYIHQSKLMRFMFDAYKETIGKYGKSFKSEAHGIDFISPLEELQGKNIDEYKSRIREWNWHRQPLGGSPLTETAPRI